MLITERSGRPLYANAALVELVGRSDAGEIGSLETALGNGAGVSEALFRLMRAAAAGERHREVVEARIVRRGREQLAALEIEVDHHTIPGQERDLGALVVWRIADITAEREREARHLRAIEETLAVYDRMPVGLAAADADGTITTLNATLAGWLGLAPGALAERDMSLSDLLSGDGAQLVAATVRRGLAKPQGLELDLLREDGRIVPVRLVLSATGHGGVVIAAVNREREETFAPESAGADQRLQRFFRSAPFGLATVGADGTITSANAAFARMILDGQSVKGEPAVDVLCRSADAETRATVGASLAEVLAGRANVQPVEITVGEGEEFTRRVFMCPLGRGEGTREAAILYCLDTTEQKRLEARFAQSSKMEAVGTLAGGIAHDFNNVLTAIIGFSDFLLESHKPGDPAHRDIMNIKQSASRAAGLVRQLLAYSRQQTLQVEVLDLGELVSDYAPLLTRSIGERIELKIATGRDLWFVKADKTQIERVLLNLAVNARDAMPDGGRITVRTRNVSERECQKLGHLGLAVGEYVAIEVEDTGTGISPDVLAKIFEPFFTTKGVGKGTGLGLSTVYGIVKQSGGFVFPESAVGKGTTFRIMLPRYIPEAETETDQAPQKATRKERPATDLTGTGRVLLVEDEDVVRSFAVRALRSRGYEVLEAATGAEALEVMQANQGRIDIVVSDVVMPEMDGPTLLKALRRKKPDLKIIFVSGYPNDAFKASLGENEQFAFLPKPFSLPELAAKVKEELAR
jgi:two-component system cell cycle sensor histidine kinase/response regulator CckA